MNKVERIKLTKKEFINNSQTLISISDENRQRILLVLMDYCDKGGIRVEDIAKKINLLRPAVSHHLKILKDEEIISIRKDGAKNYYYISGCTKILKIKNLLDNIELLVNENKERTESKNIL